ncbi:Myosin-binding striated muscle assembly central [Nakaseomyces glabratus]
MSVSKDAIETLCEELDKSATISIDEKSYQEALDEIKDIIVRKKRVASAQLPEIEKVLIRSYQDHTESKKFLREIIKSNVGKALDLFEMLSLPSIHVLVGIFFDSEETMVLLDELRTRIHYGEDPNIKYLLSIVLQLLSKFTYVFNDFSFLVRDLCLRCREPDVSPMMLLIFTQLNYRYPDEFKVKFLETMDVLIMEAEEDIGDEPLCLIVEILTELYPSLTGLCSEVLLTRGAGKMLKERATSEDSDKNFRSKLLKLLSIACIDETVRVHISEKYIETLETSMQFSEYKVLAALVLIKTWSFLKLKHIDINKLASILVDNFLDSAVLESEDTETRDTNQTLVYTIEGLAYLTLKVPIKRMLRIHEVFRNEIIKLAKKESGTNPNYFGILIIIANLTALPNDKTNPTNQTHSGSMAQLSMYANMGADTNKLKDNVPDSEEEVKEFQEKYILKKDLLADMKTKFNDMSPGSKQQYMRIVYNMTRVKENISSCVQQGVTTNILEYLVSKQDKGVAVRLLAYRSLTRILICTDPALIFNKYSPLNAIPFLFDLIGTTESGEETQEKIELNPLLENDDNIEVLDRYEALLALTNLAATPTSNGEEICKSISNTPKYWNSIVNLMLNENLLIQRSTLELISNLMSHPLPVAAKFFNFSNPQSLRNFNTLVQLIELDDIASQRAIAALFANIVISVPFISEELYEKDVLISRAIRILNDQNDDIELTQRLIIFFYGLFEYAPEKPESQKAKEKNLFKNANLRKALEKSLVNQNVGGEYKDAIPTMLALMS